MKSSATVITLPALRSQLDQGDSFHQAHAKHSYILILMQITHLEIQNLRDWQGPHDNIRNDIERVECNHLFVPINTVTGRDGDIPIQGDGVTAEYESKGLGEVVCCDDEAENEDWDTVAFDAIDYAEDKENDGETNG